MAIWSVILFVMVLALVITRPCGLPIGWTAIIGGFLAWVTGLVSTPDIVEVVSLVWDATLTFVAVILISLILDSIGLFHWAALGSAHLAGTRGRAVLWFLGLLGAAVAMFFANDGAALILTPIVYEQAKALKLPTPAALALVMTSGFIADTTSLPLVVSNLVNIVSADFFHLRFASYALVMVPVDLVALAISLAGAVALLPPYPAVAHGHRQSPSCGLRHPRSSSLPHVLACPLPPVSRIFRQSMAALARLGVCRSGRGLVCRRSLAPAYAQHPPIAARGPLEHRVVFVGHVRGGVRLAQCRFNPRLEQSRLLVREARRRKPGGRNGIDGGGGIGGHEQHADGDHQCPAIHGAHLSASLERAAAYANVIGCDLGPKLTPIGSLATLLWLHVLDRRGEHIRWGYYAKVGFTLTLPVLSVTLLGLWGWTALLG